MQDIKATIKKIKNNYFKYLTRGYWVTSIILFSWLAFFIYQNLYVTASDIKVLYMLKSQVAQEMVDMEAWNKINKEIKWKQQLLVDTTLLNNPFK